MQYTAKELIIRAEKSGFKFARQNGSHHTYTQPGCAPIVIPFCNLGDTIATGTAYKILKTLNAVNSHIGSDSLVSKEELENLKIQNKYEKKISLLESEYEKQLEVKDGVILELTRKVEQGIEEVRQIYEKEKSTWLFHEKRRLYDEVTDEKKRVIRELELKAELESEKTAELLNNIQSAIQKNEIKEELLNRKRSELELDRQENSKLSDQLQAKISSIKLIEIELEERGIELGLWQKRLESKLEELELKEKELLKNIENFNEQQYWYKECLQKAANDLAKEILAKKIRAFYGTTSSYSGSTKYYLPFPLDNLKQESEISSPPFLLWLFRCFFGKEGETLVTVYLLLVILLVLPIPLFIKIALGVEMGLFYRVYLVRKKEKIQSQEKLNHVFEEAVLNRLKSLLGDLDN